jgi:hypothetical protein
MRLRPLRLALHLVAATALAGGGVLLTGSPGTAADSAAHPDSFGGESVASAMHWVADRNPQPTPVSDAFHVESPYATTSMDSSGSITATASPLFPGNGFLGAPGLLCQFSAEACPVIQNVPPYPVIADASYPTKPDSQATAPPPGAGIHQGPLVVDPDVTVAHADADKVEARTVAGGTSFEGLTKAASASSHSKQYFEGGTLVVLAESTVSDLDIAGQLHIDKVSSVATARVDGQKVTSSSAVTKVSGATLGGVPVVIGSDGISIAGNGDGGAAEGAVNTALAALDASGMKVRLLSPSKTAKTGTASAATGGLLVSFDRESGLPNPPPLPLPPQFPGIPAYNGQYVGSVTFAGAGVTAFASPTLDVPLPALDLPLAPPPAVAGAVQQPPAGGALSAAAPAVAAAQPGAAPAAAAPPATKPVAALGVDLTSKRLKTLALVLLGYPVLVLLTAPLRAPARLPRL